MHAPAWLAFTAADALLYLLHLLVIAINTFGWLHPRLTLLHRTCLFLTLFSWLIGGWFYGWGYCFLTDWQWTIKHLIDPQHSLPPSFLTHLAHRIGWSSFGPSHSDVIAIGGLGMGLLGTLCRWFRESKRNRIEPTESPPTLLP